jgi:hypothetical protein
MIRSVTISDTETIARQLWDVWYQLQAPQIGNPAQSGFPLALNVGTDDARQSARPPFL